MYCKLYEVRLKDFWSSIETVTIYKTAENFADLTEKIKYLEETTGLEIRAVKEIEDFDGSDKGNLYKIHIVPNEYNDFDTFITAEDYVEAAKWAKEVWGREDVFVESIQEIASFNKF